MLAKQLTFMANADAAGIVLGARVPIVLTSRSDNVAPAWPRVLSASSWPTPGARARSPLPAERGGKR